MMIGDACVFALTQIANEFSCEYGELVTRRAGPDIACHSDDMQTQCECVYEQLKSIGLHEFGYEDDLTQVPHGVWSKIQFGGLLGLNALCPVSDSQSIDNISSLVRRVQSEYSTLSDIPVTTIVEHMQARRSRRRKK